MAPILYMIPASPPVRAVLMCAKSLGVELTHKNVDLLKMEHLSPEFIKINPQHTVPTLDDDGFIIWDSHAIMSYLVAKYGKNDKLYPKDIQKRAVADQRMHFENGVIFALLRGIMRPIIMEQQKVIDQKNINSAIEIYGFLESFLGDNNTWFVGDSATIADYSIYTSVSSLNVLVLIDDQKFPKLTKWLKNMNALPESEPNRIGLDAFANFVKSRLES